MTKTEATDAMKRHVKVTAGEGDERDTGYIHEVSDTMAVVGWDSGVRTKCPLPLLSAA